MKNPFRIIALAMVIAVALALAACSGFDKGKDAQSAKGSGTATTAAATTAAATTAAAQTTDTAATNETAAGNPYTAVDTFAEAGTAKDIFADSPIVGEWTCEESPELYTFNADGTGDVDNFPFTYAVKDGEVEITYPDAEEKQVLQFDGEKLTVTNEETGHAITLTKR